MQRFVAQMDIEDGAVVVDTQNHNRAVVKVSLWDSNNPMSDALEKAREMNEECERESMEQKRFRWEQHWLTHNFLIRDEAAGMNGRIEEYCDSEKEAERRTNELNKEWEEFSSSATDEEMEKYWSRYPNYYPDHCHQ